MKSMMSDNNAFSRRSFLTGAATLGAVAAAHRFGGVRAYHHGRDRRRCEG